MNHEGRSTRRALFCVAMSLAALAPPLAASTTGQLLGLVVGEDGAPLPGVTVSAAAPTQIGGERLTETDADGRFRYPRLAPGFFVVTLTLGGFVTQEVNDVQVRVDRATELHVTLPQATFGEVIQAVEARPVVDPLQVSTGQTYTDTYITETAAMEGDWRALLTQAAGVDSENYRRVLGSVPESNTFLLDSVDATDKWRRTPNFATVDLPVDAFQEVAVHTAGFEAEYGQATGGVVNLVTKSGGNDLAGTLDLRYTDSDFEESGDHYDPDEQISENRRGSFTLGGPIRRDRLWFFAAYGYLGQKWTPTGAPTTGSLRADVGFGKLSWQPSPSWSARAALSYDEGHLEKGNSSQFVAPEATNRFDDNPVLGFAELSGVLGEAGLWTLRLGRQGRGALDGPDDGDLTTIGHLNLTTGESFGNYFRQADAKDVSDDVAAELGWYVDDRAGSHDLRLGARAVETTATEDNCLVGNGRCRRGVEGYRFIDFGESEAPIPFVMLLERAEGHREFGGEFFDAFVQDTWRVRSRLTLKLGARWDSVRYGNNTGEVMRLEKLQPRLGAAWDVKGDGENVLRASWARFLSPGTLVVSFYSRRREFPTEYWTSCSLLGLAEAADCAEAAGLDGLRYRTDPEGWDPAGWVLFPGDLVQGSPLRVADDLRPMYVDQWMVGFERRLFRRTSLELSYVHKRGADLIEDTCNGNYPVPTEGAACDYFLAANLPGLRSRYEGWLLRFESRALDRVHLLGSWVVADSKGSVDIGHLGTPDYDIYPWVFQNRYGYLSDQSRHRVKLNGYARLPRDVVLAVNAWWRSDFRWTPFGRAPLGSGVSSAYPVFLEPRGSRKGGGYGNVDLQVSKGFALGPTRLRILVAAFNLLDSEQPTAVCERETGCGGNLEMGDAIEWQQPRRLEVGVRLEL